MNEICSHQTTTITASPALKALRLRSWDDKCWQWSLLHLPDREEKNLIVRWMITWKSCWFHYKYQTMHGGRWAAFHKTLAAVCWAASSAYLRSEVIFCCTLLEVPFVQFPLWRKMNCVRFTVKPCFWCTSMEKPTIPTLSASPTAIQCACILQRPLCTEEHWKHVMQRYPSSDIKLLLAVSSKAVDHKIQNKNWKTLKSSAELQSLVRTFLCVFVTHCNYSKSYCSFNISTDTARRHKTEI